MHNHPNVKWQKHEQGFILLLVLLSISGLLYVSSSFIFNILFATIMTLSTYPIFLKIKKHFNLNNTKSSAIATLGVGVVLIAPISYVLTVLGAETLGLYAYIQDFISQLNLSSKENTVNSIMKELKLSEEYADTVKEFLINNVDFKSIFSGVKDFLLFISQSAVGSVLGTFGFFAISLFTMFFLYRDGESIAHKLKSISPLHDYYDTLLMKEMTQLSGILTLSVMSIAFIQGVSFAIVAAFLDLNWLFIGVAIALTSFIPLVGTAIVWLPLSIYYMLTGQVGIAAFLFVWGAAVTGFFIDNMLRPFIVSYICKLFEGNQNKSQNKFNPLDHTLIVVISTLGGIINFNIIGLLLGPIIAGISISILDLYRIRIHNLGDESEQPLSEINSFNESENQNFEVPKIPNELNDSLNDDFENLEDDFENLEDDFEDDFKDSEFNDGNDKKN